MISDKQKLSFLQLYSEEIAHRLQFFDDSKASNLLELLDTGVVERLREESPKQFGRKLWDELQNSPLSSSLYDSLLVYFAAVEDELHGVLSIADRRSQFHVVLQNLEQFTNYLDADKCIDYLKSIDQYQDVVKSITKNWDDGTEKEYVKKLILRTIPVLGRTGVYDVMFTIHGSSEEATKFIESIHPNFQRYYKLLERERKDTRGVVCFWPEDADLTDFSQAHNFSIPEKRPFTEVDLNFDDFPNAIGVKKRLLTCIDNNMRDETPLYLRFYQKELCEAANTGENCIINAPTGSGKTVVAASIIKSHLSKQGCSKTPKVLFLVSNTAIINQQADQMTKFLQHRFDVDRMCGMDNKPIKEMINANDVIVCTPQLIVNQLQTGFSTEIDIAPNSFSLDVFTLIVFDECHNARRKSPYSVLMQHYHRAKSTGVYVNPPQIVGLTASLGVGGSTRNTREALQHIARLCALLDSKTISVVRKNIEELKGFSPPTADELDFRGLNMATKEPERMTFVDVMCEKMTELERRITAHFDQAHIKVARSNSSEDLDSFDERSHNEYSTITDPPRDKSSCEYLGWVMNHRNRLIPESSMPESTKTRVTELYEVLEVFFRALELCDDFTTRKALEYLEEKFQGKRNYLTTEISKIIEDAKTSLRPLVSDKCVLVAAVEEHLKKQHAASKDFRAIVFVRTRNGAKILSSLLNERNELKMLGIASEPLFGINAADDGSSKRQQAEKLHKFATGELRVLVSTSVAEEGLDIAQCNLVIKYNYTTNEIAHVQRRGRGRAKGSRCILVTNSDRLKKQEEGNIMKERLMQEAMGYIERRTFDLASEVEKEITDLREEIIRGDMEAKEIIERQIANGTVYELKCKKCETLLCLNKDIKTNSNGSQFCVCDPEFWKKISIKELSEESCTDSKFGEVGLIYCNGNNCGLNLGRVVRMDGCCMPVLAANSFLLLYDGRRAVEKAWKDVRKKHFTPEPVRQFDLQRMQNAATFKPTFTGTGVN